MSVITIEGRLGAGAPDLGRMRTSEASILAVCRILGSFLVKIWVFDLRTDTI